MHAGTSQPSPSRVEIVLREILRLRDRQTIGSNAARCPRCHCALVLRMGRRRPYFHCRCRRE